MATFQLLQVKIFCRTYYNWCTYRDPPTFQKHEPHHYDFNLKSEGEYWESDSFKMCKQYQRDPILYAVKLYYHNLQGWMSLGPCSSQF